VSATLDSFEIDKLYSNEEIYRSLSVGNAGGVRAKTDQSGKVERLVVMTSVPSARQARENPYHDRIEGDILIYTGAGREGNQSVSGPNARIVEQATTSFPIYGFILMGSRRDPKLTTKRWAFLGLLEYLRCYRERQIDAKGEWRNAWIFELRVHSAIKSLKKADENRAMTDVLANRRSDVDQEREVVNPEPSSRGKDFALLESVRRHLL
jgi:5-methylcytosine-specific restriction protein A